MITAIKDFLYHKATAPILAIVVLLFIGLWMWPDAAPVPSPVEPQTTLAERIWAGYYTAEVHARYHRTLAIWTERLNIGTNVVLAAVAIMLVVTAAYVANKRLTTRAKVWTLAIETVLTAMSVVLFMMDFSEMSREHTEIARRWESLATEWDNARMSRSTETQEQLRLTLANLKQKEKDIDDASPGHHFPSLLRRSQAEVNHYLGATPVSTAQDSGST